MIDAVIYRTAVSDDLPEITDLYNHYIRTTAVTFDIEPVRLEHRRVWFSQFTPGSRCQLIVAAVEKSVVSCRPGSRPVILGYAASTQFRDKAAYIHSVETSIYLHPDYIRRGLGTGLYRKLFEELVAADVHRAFACITIPNYSSVALHRSFGFVQVGHFTEAGFKFGAWRDILWMEKAL